MSVVPPEPESSHYGSCLEEILRDSHYTGSLTIGIDSPDNLDNASNICCLCQHFDTVQCYKALNRRIPECGRSLHLPSYVVRIDVLCLFKNNKYVETILLKKVTLLNNYVTITCSINVCNRDYIRLQNHMVIFIFKTDYGQFYFIQFYICCKYCILASGCYFGFWDKL